MLATSAFAAPSLCRDGFVVWTFPWPQMSGAPAIKSLHLPVDNPTDLARDYRATGFPDFDRFSYANHFAYSPFTVSLLKSANNGPVGLSPTSYQAAPPREDIIA